MTKARLKPGPTFLLTILDHDSRFRIHDRASASVAEPFVRNVSFVLVQSIRFAEIVIGLGIRVIALVDQATFGGILRPGHRSIHVITVQWMFDHRLPPWLRVQAVGRAGFIYHARCLPYFSSFPLFALSISVRSHHFDRLCCVTGR
jgi:hypothetical protein